MINVRVSNYWADRAVFSLSITKVLEMPARIPKAITPTKPQSELRLKFVSVPVVIFRVGPSACTLMLAALTLCLEYRYTTGETHETVAYEFGLRWQDEPNWELSRRRTLVRTDRRLLFGTAIPQPSKPDPESLLRGASHGHKPGKSRL